jgi:RHS repeat-associated protein
MDPRGNVSFTTNGAGEVTSHIGYGPFGKEVVYGLDEDGFGFVGAEAVGDRRILLVGSRFYDEDSARFLSQDPIFNPINEYGYSVNPVWWSDKNGAFASPVPKVSETFTALSAGAGLVGAIAALGIGATAGVFAVGAAPVWFAFAAAFFGVAFVADMIEAKGEERVRKETERRLKELERQCLCYKPRANQPRESRGGGSSGGGGDRSGGGGGGGSGGGGFGFGEFNFYFGHLGGLNFASHSRKSNHDSRKSNLDYYKSNLDYHRRQEEPCLA